MDRSIGNCEWLNGLWGLSLGFLGWWKAGLLTLPEERLRWFIKGAVTVTQRDGVRADSVVEMLTSVDDSFL